MQNTTALYDAYKPVRRVKTKATFELIDVDANINAVPSASDGTAFSILEQTHDKITDISAKFATLESNYWKLDGSFFTIHNTRNNGQIGYWSNDISDKYGNINITMSFEFSIPQTSKFFTVIFDDRTKEYAKDFTLTTYSSSGSVLNTKTVSGNTLSVAVIEMASISYKKLVIKFTKTANPYRRIRVCEVVFGYLQSFTDDDISSINIQYTTSIDSQSLPSCAMSITLNNIDKQYNIINPNGIYKYLQKGQGINLSIYLDGEYISLGRYYFENSTSDDNSMTATINAYDKIYSLDNKKCNIGTTGTWTIDEAVSAVISDSGEHIEVKIPDRIASRTIGRCIPQGTTHREALRMIAQAGMSVCYINRNSVLEFIEPSTQANTEVIDNNKMSKYPKVSDNGLINSIKITVKNEYAENSEEKIYTASDIADDETEKLLEINNPLVLNQEVAEWILKMQKYRIAYDIEERGNPALEITDCIQINDVYGENKNGFIINEAFSIGIGLQGTIRAVTANE